MLHRIVFERKSKPVAHELHIAHHRLGRHLELHGQALTVRMVTFGDLAVDSPHPLHGRTRDAFRKFFRGG